MCPIICCSVLTKIYLHNQQRSVFAARSFQARKRRGVDVEKSISREGCSRPRSTSSFISRFVITAARIKMGYSARGVTRNLQHCSPGMDDKGEDATPAHPRGYRIPAECTRTRGCIQSTARERTAVQSFNHVRMCRRRATEIYDTDPIYHRDNFERS